MSEAKVVIRVQEVMATEFDLVDGVTTVSEALRSVQHPQNRAWIVNKRNDADAYGIVLMSDIARQVLARGRAPERVSLYEIMTKPVLPVDPMMSVRHCAQLFERFDLSRAPVIDRGFVVGLVSVTDLVLKGLCAARDVPHA